MRSRSRGDGRHRSVRTIFYATCIDWMVMEQKLQGSPDSRVWDDRATEVIAGARKLCPESGDVLGSRKRDACALLPRSIGGWRLSKSAHVGQAAIFEPPGHRHRALYQDCHYQQPPAIVASHHNTHLRRTTASLPSYSLCTFPTLQGQRPRTCTKSAAASVVPMLM
jgi:hypothetical protein